MNKVYCKDCKNFSFYYVRCNLVKKLKDTPFALNEIYYDYQKQNKNNDCVFYKKRGIESKQIKKTKKWYRFWREK